MDLEPCPSCRRHVRVDEPACPFCAAALPAFEPRRFAAGRFTRAAVFAGASLVTAACGGKTKPADAVGNVAVDGGIEPTDAVENVAVDGGVEPAPPDARPYEEPVKMPYGAPPLRVRVV